MHRYSRALLAAALIGFAAAALARDIGIGIGIPGVEKLTPGAPAVPSVLLIDTGSSMLIDTGAALLIHP